MVVDLTLKAPQYKAVKVRTSPESFHDIQELFGDNLDTSEGNFMELQSIVVTVNNKPHRISCIPGRIIVAEYSDEELTGVLVSNDLDELTDMFSWEGEL